MANLFGIELIAQRGQDERSKQIVHLWRGEPTAGLLLAVALTQAAACWSVGASAARSANPELALAVRAQRARFLATIRGDLAALNTLLADDAIYVHTTGRVETKTQFLESLRSRRLVYDAIEVGGVETRVGSVSDARINRTPLRRVDGGRLLITSQRVLLEGTQGSLAWRLRDIACYQAYDEVAHRAAH